jgi:hypothetical protein
VGISKGGFLVGSAIILHGLIQGQKLHDDALMEIGVTAGFCCCALSCCGWAAPF